MIPSRKLAAMFLCVFVLGAVAGALILYNVGDMRFSQFLNRTADPASLADRIDKKLASQYGLDADEQQRIAPLSKELAQNLYQMRLKYANDVVAALDVSHEKIAAQMSAAHRDAYMKDNVDRHKRAVSMLMPSASSAPAQP